MPSRDSAQPTVTIDSAQPTVTIEPVLDPHNQSLIARVHPPDWVNPTPTSRYNLVVIGGGTAGLVAAVGAAGLGARVALVERRLLGGDCLNFGCVPSKAMLRSARAVGEINRAAVLGVGVTGELRVDFAQVMQRMRRLRAELSMNDSAERLRNLGVDVFLGDAVFGGRDHVVVDGNIRLRFRRAVIATGARPAALPIPGLAEAGYLTNETVFGLTELPRRLAVVGAGPIGCELGQALRRFGAEVTILEALPEILPREDRAAAAIVRQALERDGIRIVTGCRLAAVTRNSEGKLLEYEDAGTRRTLTVDEILLAAGRTPAVDGLGLVAAGVVHDPRRGIVVDDHLRTANRRIFAAGDIATAYQFTHVADAMARIVLRNALFHGRARFSRLTIPWCVYTDPEIAQVGLDEATAAARGVALKTFTQEFREVDRAVIDNEREGLLKIHVEQKRATVVGATIVASHASEMIGELTLAISQRVGLGALADLIHPYPTQAEAVRKATDQFNRTRLTPRVKRLFARWFALTR